jgi:hypothetical protein
MPDETEAEEALPVMYDHSLKVFKAMFEKATPERLPGYDEPVMVYTGHLTKLITDELKLPNPYYTATTRELVRMGCILQLRRGGGNASSQWVLVKMPSEQLWREKVATKRRSTSRLDFLEQGQRDIHNRLTQLENQIRQLLGGQP